MRITALTVTMLAATLTTGSVAAGAEPVHEITVSLVDEASVSFRLKAFAQHTASEMFAQAGIRIHWRNGESGSNAPESALVVKLVTGTPARVLPGALAFARPYGGGPITVFFDRIEVGASPRALLAHVMVHEITHILQGSSQHSESGIMKANWSAEDQAGMSNRPLRFTRLDVELIHQGIARRASAGKPEIAADSEY